MGRGLIHRQRITRGSANVHDRQGAECAVGPMIAVDGQRVLKESFTCEKRVYNVMRQNEPCA